mgnify:FL=1
MYNFLIMWYNMCIMTVQPKFGSLLEQICYEYEKYGRFKTHIPSHHVIYIRAALKGRTGKDFSVEDIEKALVAEGMSQYV